MNDMAVLRRRRVTILVVIAAVLVFAAVLSSNYTTQDTRVTASGDSLLIVNDKRHLEMENRHLDTEIDEASLTSVESKMTFRKKQLNEACAMMKANNLSAPNQDLYQHEVYRHLMVSEEKHILYCYLPKVANTNFRRVFLGLNGVVPKSEVPVLEGYDIYFKYDNMFKFINLFKPETQSEMLHVYKKFVVVRDPLERLLSAYRNKFFHPNLDHRRSFHNKVVEFYRHNPALRNKRYMRMDFTSKEMTFKEFLIYWSDVFDAHDYLNEHFVASNQLCNPCLIQYDYIGKYETLNTDVSYIFSQLNIDIEFPGRNDNYSSVSTSTLVENFYKPIPAWLLKKVWEILKFDYFLFGYRLPQWFTEKIHGR